MRTRWRLPALAGVALVAGMAAGGGTFALWSADAATPAQIVNAGNLDIAAGAVTWTETSTDVPSSPQTIDPATFLVRQGDTVTAEFAFTTTLQGDNMLGQLSVDWTDPSALPAGVTATYQVYDASNNALLTTEPDLGAAATLNAATQQIDADDAGRTDNFTVLVSLDFSGMADRFGSGSTVQTADLGTFEVTLEQSRTGVGFQ